MFLPSLRQTMNKLLHGLVFLGGQLLDGFQPRREALGRLLLLAAAGWP